MQTPFFARLTALVRARRTSSTPAQLDAPVELATSELQHVGGGLAPRGGWQATADATLSTAESTTQAPRGGW